MLFKVLLFPRIDPKFHVSLTGLLVNTENSKVKVVFACMVLEVAGAIEAENMYGTVVEYTL
jgi:hypothetical protein